MKYDKGSIIDKKVTHFPVRYVFYFFIIWIIAVAALIYFGIQ